MTESLSNASAGIPRAPIRIVVNADDFGLSARINSGIIQAHREGIVTATSLMAVGRAFEHAVQLSRTVSTLDVGVHLTVVAETPLLRGTSSLAGTDSRFPRSAGAFTWRWLTGRIRRADVEAEWCAQIERVLASGISVSHVDSHQHVHILPGLLDLARIVAGRYGIPFVRMPVEDWRVEWSPNLHEMSRLLGCAALRLVWIASRLWGAGQPPRPPLRFLGFQDGGRLDEERLRRLLADLRPGETYELMCHPGLTPEEPDLRRWAYRHEQELHALTSPVIRSEIAARNIRLCSFKDLKI